MPKEVGKVVAGKILGDPELGKRHGASTGVMRYSV